MRGRTTPMRLWNACLHSDVFFVYTFVVDAKSCARWHNGRMCAQSSKSSLCKNNGLVLLIMIVVETLMCLRKDKGGWLHMAAEESSTHPIGCLDESSTARSRQQKRAQPRLRHSSLIVIITVTTLIIGNIGKPKGIPCANNYCHAQFHQAACRPPRRSPPRMSITPIGIL